MARRNCDLVVVGASAGGVEALRDLVAGLPADFPGAVVVVLHMPAGGTSALPAILDRSGPLPAVAVRHGAVLRPGVVHVAPPNHHTLVMDGGLALTHGPTENGHRPAIDALFRSAALSRGPAVAGVQLSGVLDDGVAGLVAIAGRGGRVVVQEPTDALHPSMPANALRAVRADHVLPASELGKALADIVREEVDVSSAPAPTRLMRMENEIAAHLDGPPVDPDRYVLGPASGYSCPDCDGSLSEIEDVSRYRCRVGHAWTAEALLEAQGTAWERALWIAMRTLEEKVSLSRRLAEQARGRGNPVLADRYEQRLAEAAQAAELLRHTLTSASAQSDSA